MCRVLSHKPWCSCPQCHLGKPTEQCRPDPRCHTEGRPMYPNRQCSSSEDCPKNLACNEAIGMCENPCQWTIGTQSLCTPSHKCEVFEHRATCVCKMGLVINENMELVCPLLNVEGCRSNYDCPDNLACIGTQCQSPCSQRHCDNGKVCKVVNHEAACYCETKECTAVVSICLKDAGCPDHLKCVNYVCVDPCITENCPAGCFARNHNATCKFCPEGYAPDGTRGCKGNPKVECFKLLLTTNSNCSIQEQFALGRRVTVMVHLNEPRVHHPNNPPNY